MLPFITFLQESHSQFTDLESAIRRAKQDGLLTQNVKSLFHGITLEKVPADTKKLPLFAYTNDKGGDDYGLITLYEPTKKSKADYTDNNGKRYMTVEIWQLMTPAQAKMEAKRKQEEEDEERAYQDRRKNIILPKQRATNKAIYDAVVKAISAGISPAPFTLLHRLPAVVRLAVASRARLADSPHSRFSRRPNRDLSANLR